MSASLAGRQALVTGGGSGIGLACAARLVTDGCSVTICGRSVERLDDAVRVLQPMTTAGASVSRVAADVTDEDAIAGAVAAAAGESGELHIVVASAGGGSMNRLEHTTRAEWDGVVDLVMTGTFLTVRAAIGPLVAGAASVGDASLVAISSIAGHRTHRFMTPYSVAKAGLDMLVANAADELGDRGVRVNSVRPGLIDTDLVGVITGDDSMRHDYLAQTPLGRVGTPADVAEVVRFLAGPESRWVTGAAVPVDGGHHLRRGPDFSGWFGG